MGFCLIFVVKVIVKEVEERESEGCGVSRSKKMYIIVIMDGGEEIYLKNNRIVR